MGDRTINLDREVREWGAVAGKKSLPTADKRVESEFSGLELKSADRFTAATWESLGTLGGAGITGYGIRKKRGKIGKAGSAVIVAELLLAGGAAYRDYSTSATEKAKVEFNSFVDNGGKTLDFVLRQTDLPNALDLNETMSVRASHYNLTDSGDIEYGQSDEKEAAVYEPRTGSGIKLSVGDPLAFEAIKHARDDSTITKTNEDDEDSMASKDYNQALLKLRNLAELAYLDNDQKMLEDIKGFVNKFIDFHKTQSGDEAKAKISSARTVLKNIDSFIANMKGVDAIGSSVDGVVDSQTNSGSPDSGEAQDDGTDDVEPASPVATTSTNDEAVVSDSKSVFTDDFITHNYMRMTKDELIEQFGQNDKKQPNVSGLTMMLLFRRIQAAFEAGIVSSNFDAMATELKDNPGVKEYLKGHFGNDEDRNKAVDLVITTVLQSQLQNKPEDGDTQ